MKRVWIVFSFVLALLVGTSACQQEASAPAPGQWKSDNHLVFSGGRGNFPRIGNWLLEGMFGQYPRGEFTGEILMTGNGYAVEMDNILAGDAQLGVSTPAATPYMSAKGNGLFSAPNPNLRGLLKIPRRMFIIFAVREDLGVSSIEDIVDNRVPLRLATGLMTGDDTKTFTCLEILNQYGITVDSLQAQGGDIVQVGPRAHAAIADGRANALCDQGANIDSEAWKDVNETTPMRMLSIRQDVLNDMASIYGYDNVPRTFEQGAYPGVLEDVSTLAYDDWIVVGDARIPDDMAYRIVKAGVENIDRWLSWYPESSPDSDTDALGLIRPEPRLMWQNLGVPLHPGAERFFREMGYMR